MVLTARIIWSTGFDNANPATVFNELSELYSEIMSD